MKKTSKMIGAVALASALALGTAVPAFAADPTFPDDYTAGIGEYDHQENLRQNSEVNTQVNVATVVTNINVAVPIDLTIVANSAGGDVVAPSSGVKPNGGTTATGYRIENYSEYPVAIKNIKTEENGEDWKLVESIPADLSRDTAAGAKIGDLALDLAPSDAVDTPDVNEGNQNAKGGKVGLKDICTANGVNPEWTVASGQKGTNGKVVPSIMGLTLAGKSSALQNVHSNSVLEGTAVTPGDPDASPAVPADPFEADKAFKIIYTVAVGTVAGA